MLGIATFSVLAGSDGLATTEDMVVSGAFASVDEGASVVATAIAGVGVLVAEAEVATFSVVTATVIPGVV